MKITVFGTGYVGLVQAATLAELGHDVMCVDINHAKINQLNDGIIPFFEPGLDQLVERNKLAHRLSFSLNPKECIEFADILFIAVGTPSYEDGSADLSAIETVAKTIGNYINGYKLIINKSTVPVGTVDLVKNTILETLAENASSYVQAMNSNDKLASILNRDKIEFDVISNPEFLKEGTAVIDSLHPERIIIGSNSKKALSIMRKLYHSFTKKGIPILEMDVRSAELTKYAANCMLATKISFINEMARLAELLGADIDAIKAGIASDSRIGPSFIDAGCGYGGSCFPKDIQCLINKAKEHQFFPHLLTAIEAVNSEQKTLLVDRVLNYYGHDISGKHFAIWGLSFKPETDDIRNSPSLTVINSICKLGATCTAFDPVAITNSKQYFANNQQVTFAESKELALIDADALIICTDWQQFYEINFDILKTSLTEPVIFDGRNLFSLADAIAQNITYISIGRKPVYRKEQYLNQIKKDSA
ncbi:UDP-glucose dehydrogenase family protein [Thorsellia anophelis]|uniref:UDP-glucose 6-dehydrogenase n=1 Tax=Thorsellia anophelis DSM 18579 TaxID=1123402 RepID=A0A1I0BPQ2_9GAMM|nr:UDP-glucose/GDP-mannose dehydrogenase family protein [Thorsellia anophelis]SET08294.1 UDPglucose 6-dehydrogenase [Thorsellia anophelis DSM 18579]